MDTLIIVAKGRSWSGEGTPRTRLTCPQNGRHDTVLCMIPAEVRDYLDSVDGERGDALREVFATVAEAMPAGFELGMGYGMPGWVVPLATYPVTYNKQPLAYVSIAAHKSYNSLYLLGLYSDSDEERTFRDDWAATGLKLDMGKSCLRFRNRADVDLAIIARTVAGTSVDRVIEFYERSH